MYWFVLNVKRKNEIKVASLLEAAGFKVYCPTYTTVKKWSDRKKKVTKPLIATYIFIKIKEKHRAKVFEIPGIIRYLFYLGEPAKVLNKEIKILKDFLKEGASVPKIENIKPGDNHLITNGPFKGKNGVVQEVGNNRLQVVLKELGIKVTLQKKNL
ncbi:UpxY family transcription antiterminator [Lutibacter sp. A64]|uniref:transcription termination/antitermination protein NusG n=1 Tax=Lutibacter sp. A64 TaxID=2918526 RepID=UPI001F06BBF0|nr:UpxY family transcription antiterminator [Lutibacter sp. A64]UMB54349.1 UpxY family transcription antiterminator [Lutibacter sp. A64]